MFVKHNMGGWYEPSDFEFEPSPIWHDTDDIAVDETAKVFLRNLLGKSRKGLEAAKGLVDAKQKEVQGLQRMRDQLKFNEDNAQKEIDVTRVRNPSLRPSKSVLTFPPRAYSITKKNSSPTPPNSLPSKLKYTLSSKLSVMSSVVPKPTNSNLPPLQSPPTATSVENAPGALLVKASPVKTAATPATPSAK